MVLYRSPLRVVFEVFLYVFFLAFLALVLVPLMNVVAVSLSSKDAVMSFRVSVLPVEFQTKAYELILSSRVFLSSFGNTLLVTVANTAFTIVIAACAGYALANRSFVGARVVFGYFLFAMYFSGGLIPFYLTVNAYGLNNTRLALILPYLVSVFYIIVFRNTIARLPREIVESAEVDGAPDRAILFRIVLPLLLPMVAAFTIISAVGFWNMWFPVLIFIRDQSKWTLQYLLRHTYTNPGMGVYAEGIVENPENINPEHLINAAIVCTIAPIIVIYPFLQRYFIHGVLVGAVKE
jgi:putative aldouronate transport system permease protein